MSSSEQAHVLKAGAPAGDPQQYDAYEIQNFFQNTDPSGVGVAGQAYQTTGGYALMIANDLDAQGKAIFDQWQGPAALIAQQALAQLRNTAQQFGEACNKVGAALNDYSAKLGTYKSMNWPAINSDIPPKPTQLAALNRAAQQAMTQANGDMHAAWSAMPASLTSELPGISTPKTGGPYNSSGPAGPGYTPGPSHSGSPYGNTGTAPHQPGNVPPAQHNPGNTTTLPPGSPNQPGNPNPSHLSSLPPGPQPAPGATPPPVNPGMPPGVTSPPPGVPSSPVPLPGPVGPGLSSAPPPEDPLNPGAPTPPPPGEELPPPGMVRPFAPGPEPIGNFGPTNPGRLGPNTSVEASAPVSDDFAVAAPGPGMPSAMAAQDEALGLSAAEMSQRDMLGMPMMPMTGSAGPVSQTQGQIRSSSVTEEREVWVDDVESNSPVIGDAPNYLGLTGRRPIRPEPGERLSSEELSRLLHDAVTDSGDSGHLPASIPGELSGILDGVNAGATLPGGTIGSR